MSVLPFGQDGREGLVGMIGVDKIGEIRRAYFEQRRPIKEIVRTLGVSRATVRKGNRKESAEPDFPRRACGLGFRQDEDAIAER